MSHVYLNFGAGNPTKTWVNLDSSPFFLFPKVVHTILDTLSLSTRSQLFLKHPYQYYKYVTGKRLPFANKSVDAVYLSHVLEHLSVSEIDALFSEFARIIKPQGSVRVILPDLEGNIETAQKKSSSCWYSLDSGLLTLPTELKTNTVRAALEAISGFPSFHKTLIFKDKIKKHFSKKWTVSLELE